MDDEDSVPREEFDYRSGRSLPKELALRRRLETKDHALRKRGKDLAALQRELGLMEEQVEELRQEKLRAETGLERQRSTVQSLQGTLAQLQRDLSRESRRRKSLEKQRVEDAAAMKAQETLLGSWEARTKSLLLQLEEQQQRVVRSELEATERVLSLRRVEEASRDKDRVIEELQHQAGLLHTRRQSSEDEQMSLSAALAEKTSRLLQVEEEAETYRLQVEQLTRAQETAFAELQAAGNRHRVASKEQEKAVLELTRRGRELEESNATLKRNVFVLEEEVKTLKRHLEATSRLVEQSKGDAEDRVRKEYLNSDEHLSLRQSLTDARKEIAALRAIVTSRDHMVTELEDRLHSCERSAMLIAQDKHEEIEAKEGLAMRCRMLHKRSFDLEQQTKVLQGEVHVKNRRLRELKEGNLRMKSLLNILRKENTILRRNAVGEQLPETQIDPLTLSADDAWMITATQVIEELVLRLYGSVGKGRNKKRKAIVIELISIIIQIITSLVWSSSGAAYITSCLCNSKRRG